ncbi:Nitronate monooxygenase [compost metagenome]
MKNELTDRILQMEKDPQLTHEELLTLASSHRWVKADLAGNPDDGAFAASVAVGLIEDIPSCAELVQRIISEAQHIVRQRLTNMLR